MNISRHILPFFLLLALAAGLASCANPGSGPDGGPYDETPPSVLQMSPQLGESNVKKAKKITLTFSENVKLENASEKVVVSPPQLEVPEIKVSGRQVSIELMDKLRPNTTYTVDFSNAITDATEGNPLGQFTYYFSTGESVDTMEVGGTVLDASNLTPVSGILVGLHSNLNDTAFTNIPLERVARTDSRGRFSIKGVAPGTYRVFALQDMDGDFKYTRGEKLAFTTKSYVPSSYPDVRYDTVWADTIHYDSIRTINYTHFTPDDIVLLAFQETSVIHSLLKMQRDIPTRFTAYFTAPNDKRPVVRGLNFDASKALIEDHSAHSDTITYWIQQPDVAHNDTLRFLYSYQATNDSTHQLYERTDTMEMVPRLSNARLDKERAEKEARWQKQLEKRHKRGDYTQERMPVEALKMSTQTASPFTPIDNVNFSLEEPVLSVDSQKFHLFQKVDSTETAVPFRIERTGLLKFRLIGEWRPGQKYRLAVDSAAVVGMSGLVNKSTTLDINIATAEEVGSLFITIPDADSTAIVQLLSSDTKVERQLKVKNHRADFFYVRPGTYYVRCFLDSNGNGKWDVGEYATQRQAEEVFYLPTPITVSANWDVDQNWTLRALPLTEQKPAKLSKVKTDSKRESAHQKNLNRKRETK